MPFLGNSIPHLIRSWKAVARASIVREMEFRANFFAGIIRQAAWLWIFIFMIDVIFQNTEQLAGWEKDEVFVIIGLSRVIEGLMGILFIRNIMELPARVRQGEFDFHLTKPIPSQLYTAFRRFDIDNFGNVFVGMILLGYALTAITAPPSIMSIITSILIIIAGIVIYYSILITASTLVFILDRLEFLWGFNILLSEPLTVPFDIFPRTPRIALTYLIPIAFVVFVPAQSLTGRLSWWQAPLAIALAALFLTVANTAWRAGLRRYASASS